MGIGDKARERIKTVPENIKAAADDVRRESVATAVSEVPKRFGKANRRFMER